MYELGYFSLGDRSLRVFGKDGLAKSDKARLMASGGCLFN